MTENCDKNKIRILFVCLGNICRSPMAETVFQKQVEDRRLAEYFEIDSAGLIDYHEGDLADNRMRQHASEHGYYITHRSRPITRGDFQTFNYIVGMDFDNRRALLSLASTDEQRAKILNMADYLRYHTDSTVPDPYYGGASGFEHVIALLEDACEGLLEELLAKGLIIATNS